MMTATSTYKYDADNLAILDVDAPGNQTINTYNADGQTTSKMHNDGTGATYVYDPLGHLILTTFLDGSTITATYDANGDESRAPISRVPRRSRSMTQMAD